MTICGHSSKNRIAASVATVVRVELPPVQQDILTYLQTAEGNLGHLKMLQGLTEHWIRGLPEGHEAEK